MVNREWKGKGTENNEFDVKRLLCRCSGREAAMQHTNKCHIAFNIFQLTFHSEIGKYALSWWRRKRAKVKPINNRNKTEYVLETTTTTTGKKRENKIEIVKKRMKYVLLFPFNFK